MSFCYLRLTVMAISLGAFLAFSSISMNVYANEAGGNSSEKDKDYQVAKETWNSELEDHEALALLCKALQPIAQTVKDFLGNGDSDEVSEALYDLLSGLYSAHPVEMEAATYSQDQLYNVAVLLVYASTNSEELCAPVSEIQKSYTEISVKPFYVHESSSDSVTGLVTSVYANRSIHHWRDVGFLQHKSMPGDITTFFEGSMNADDKSNEPVDATTLARVGLSISPRSIYAFRPHDPQEGVHFVVGLNAAGGSYSSYGLTLDLGKRKTSFHKKFKSITTDTFIYLDLINSSEGISGEYLGFGMGTTMPLSVYNFCSDCIIDIGGMYEFGSSSSQQYDVDANRFDVYMAFENMLPASSFSIRAEAGYSTQKGLGVNGFGIVGSDKDLGYLELSIIYRMQWNKYKLTGISLFNDSAPGFPGKYKSVKRSGSGRSISRVDELHP